MGEDLEHATFPYIITEDLPSHQSLNKHTIVEVSPKLMIPKPNFEQSKEEHTYSGESHEHLNSEIYAPLYLDVLSPTSLNQVQNDREEKIIRG